MPSSVSGSGLASALSNAPVNAVCREPTGAFDGSLAVVEVSVNVPVSRSCPDTKPAGAAIASTAWPEKQQSSTSTRARALARPSSRLISSIGTAVQRGCSALVVRNARCSCPSSSSRPCPA
nr:hypothetical protein [Amycolatopsis kentuckyensis]